MSLENIESALIAVANSIKEKNSQVIVSVANDGTSSPTTQSGYQTWRDKYIDTHNAMNISTGFFTAPKKGIYYLNYSGFTDTGAGTGAIRIRINGTSITRTYQTAGGYNAVAINYTRWLDEGDTLAIYTDVTMHKNNAGQMTIISLNNTTENAL